MQSFVFVWSVNWFRNHGWTKGLFQVEIVTINHNFIAVYITSLNVQILLFFHLSNVLFCHVLLFSISTHTVYTSRSHSNSWKGTLLLLLLVVDPLVVTNIKINLLFFVVLVSFMSLFYLARGRGKKCKNITTHRWCETQCWCQVINIVISLISFWH